MEQMPLPRDLENQRFMMQSHGGHQDASKRSHLPRPAGRLIAVGRYTTLASAKMAAANGVNN